MKIWQKITASGKAHLKYLVCIAGLVGLFLVGNHYRLATSSPNEKAQVSSEKLPDVYAQNLTAVRRPAAACVEKLNVYEYKDQYGRLQKEECPENCSDEADFPGYDENNPGTFSRSQDTTGSCRTFATADYICYQLRRLKLWPSSPEYKQGCSAFDLEVQAYAAQKKSPGKNNIKDFLGDPNESNPVMNDSAQLINIAQTIGICPESAFPSDFRNNQHRTLRRVYDALQAHLRTKKNMAGSVPLIGFCPECEAVAPNLTATQWRAIEQELNKVSNLDTDDFVVLKKINDIACPPEKRVKLPRNIVENGKVIESFEMRDHDMSEMIKRLTKADSIAILQAHAHELDPENVPKTTCTPKERAEDESRAPDKKKCGNDYHALVLFGTIGRIINGKPTCLYALKNSWGSKACVERPPDIYCDKEKGTYFVSQTMLAMISTSFKW